MLVLYALVLVLTVFIGVFAIGLGILVGLDPVGVFVAASLSSLIYTWVVLAGGSSLLRRLFPAAMVVAGSPSPGDGRGGVTWQDQRSWRSIAALRRVS